MAHSHAGSKYMYMEDNELKCIVTIMLIGVWYVYRSTGIGSLCKMYSLDPRLLLSKRDRDLESRIYISGYRENR